MALPQSPRCVVTGAASGFGRGLALALAARRGHLILADVDEAGAAETARQATVSGAASTRVVRCDVTRFEEVDALARSIDDPVDLLANNAGVCSSGGVGEASIEDWRWTLEVDLMGVIYGCHAFLPRMRAVGRGHVLNVASAAGIVTAPRMAAYNVAKAGVIALSESMAAELAGTGIGVTVLCPTFFQSNIAKGGRFVSERDRAAAERMIAGGKRCEDVVRAALKAVDAERLYCLPMAEARWLWRLKRLVPAVMPPIVGRLTRVVVAR